MPTIVRHAVAAGLAFASLSLAACGLGSTNPGVCTTEVRPGLTVTVLDSVTGVRAAEGSSLLAVDGAYRDSTTFAVDSTLSAAYERSGTYQVTLRHAGYRDWTRAGVSVSSGVCHVNTTRLRALLQR